MRRAGLVLVCMVSALCGAAALQIDAPRCEGARNPLGLKRTQPRFSWALRGAEGRKGQSLLT